MITGLVGCASNDDTDNVLRVGIDLKFYPFMYMDEDGTLTGLEVDISHAFGEYIGKEVEIINTDFSMLIPALDTGDIDIITSEISEEDFFAIYDMSFAGLTGTIATSIPRERGADVVEFTEIVTALMEVTRGHADALVGTNTIWGDHAANADTTMVYEGVSDVSADNKAMELLKRLFIENEADKKQLQN